MSELTTERLERKIKNCIEIEDCQVMLPLSAAEELLAFREAAKNPVAIIENSEYMTAEQLAGEEPHKKAVKELYEGALVVGSKLYAAPVLPKQPELVDLSQQVEILNRILNWILKELPVPTQKASAMAIRLSSVIDIISDLSFQHPAQLVSKPYKLPVGYFSYGTEHGFNWHQTAKQATDDAEAMIDDYRGDACDGWSEETDNVCWGVILQQAGKVNERPRTDDDNDNIAPHIDTVCDYALLPAQENE